MTTEKTTQTRELPVIAIIGRPNVGKSALFNLIAGKRLAIVHQESGVTRDSIAAPVDWYGQKFMLMDTGGLAMRHREQKADIFDTHIREQVRMVTQQASCLIWVVDGQAGRTPQDAEVADFLRELGKPVVVAVNKADNQILQQSVTDDFNAFGFADLFAVSCLHHFGVSPLIDHCLSLLAVPTATDDAEIRTDTPLRLAVIGRPNVGKSSLVNRLLGEERVMVSDIPGTTRDAVDLPLQVDDKGVKHDFMLIDTAGLRRRRELDSAVEIFSVMRAENAIKRCDIAFLVLDATAPATAQDRRIASLLADAGKPCIILANKWDLAGGEIKRKELIELVNDKMTFMNYAPIVCTCAISGYGLKEAITRLLHLTRQMQSKVPTPVINQFLQDLFLRTPPPAASKGRLKFFYATMSGKAPPKFILFVNNARNCPAAYRQFIRNQMAKAFFPDCGLPVLLELRSRRDPELTGDSGRRQAAAGVMHRKSQAAIAIRTKQQKKRYKR